VVTSLFFRCFSQKWPRRKVSWTFFYSDNSWLKNAVKEYSFWFTICTWLSRTKIENYWVRSGIRVVWKGFSKTWRGGPGHGGGWGKGIGRRVRLPIFENWSFAFLFLLNLDFILRRIIELSEARVRFPSLYIILKDGRYSLLKPFKTYNRFYKMGFINHRNKYPFKYPNF
jgi:hypothetical protein